jgi:probable rRNA maturation factor
MSQKIEIQISYGTSVTLKDLPLAKVQLNKIFSTILKNLKSDDKFLNAQNILGSGCGRLGLYVCNDLEMRTFQKNYRKLDRTTDVLSFPSLELDFKEIQALPVSERSLGDLILSLPAIERGAERGKQSLGEEFLEVFIHGILHLIGYDHVLKNAGVSLRQAQKMRKLQKKLFLLLRADIKNGTYVRKNLA